MAAECLACGSRHVSHWATARDVEYAAVPESFDYVRCGDCCTLSIVDPPRDRLGEIYPDTYYSFSETGASRVERVKAWLDRRQFRKIFAGVKGDRLSALDVGGGAGWLLTTAKAVEPRLMDTTVVDLDPAAETLAKAAGHDFFLGPVETYETAKRFDVIFLLNLIEHVADPVAVLTRMRGLLAPGGVIFVKTPNHDSLDARLFRHRSWGGLHAPRHWVIFSPESFGKAAAKADLRVTSLKLTQGAPFWTVSALEALGRLGLVKTSRQRPMVAHPLFGPLTAAFAALDILRRPFGRTSQMFVTLTA
ncbi:Methyltransferase [Sphingomonas antarctica]|uniref:class I SAM-dependent methyltransferase n=1 Tax=Sphingomonas antarctica TaxID=2040274 RepID=UPI0039E841ED